MEYSKLEAVRLSLNVEVWKKIEDFDGYEISSLGRVKSKKGKEERILKSHINKRGYELVAFHKDGKMTTKKVHRLVGFAFIENNHPEVRNQINHRWGIKHHNWVEAIEWVSSKENIIHSYQVLGRIGPRGEICGNSKLVKHQVREIRELLKEGVLTQKDIAEMYDTHPSNISYINTGKTWTDLI